ncbi:hypothetical protein BDP27DRAFT_1444396 [Rhodocollybia butyracea]|uniref:Uncharacterized protein n=1 Tax=Rhodocollybia butyracea TaxID=206335 RepID=A0A9P5Q4U8_9AGAR|nr:hypothetical protein BDP27DRAFT_1444396 [Rhodocollybia butyracea]
MFDDDQLLPPWSFPHKSDIRIAFSFVVMAPHTPWKDTPEIQDLEFALGDLEKTIRKLHETNKWFIPRLWLPDYNLFWQKLLYLYNSKRRFNCAYNIDGWENIHLGMGSREATPAQWNMRAKMTRSRRLCCYYPPLAEGGRFITFPPNTTSAPISSRLISLLPMDDSFRSDDPAKVILTPCIPERLRATLGFSYDGHTHSTHPSPRSSSMSLPTSNVCSKCKQTLLPHSNLTSSSPPPSLSPPPPPPPQYTASPPPPPLQYTASPSASSGIEVTYDFIDVNISLNF